MRSVFRKDQENHCMWLFVFRSFVLGVSTFASISMGRGNAWKAHDIDVVLGWMAAGKTTTAMAKLRPGWPWSSIKKLVARLRARAAAGDAPGPVFARKRSFTAVSCAQLDELQAELPTLPRVSVDVVAKRLGTSRSTAWRVLHDRLQKKPYKPIKAQRIAPATVLRRMAFCRVIRLKLGARIRLCSSRSIGLAFGMS